MQGVITAVLAAFSPRSNRRGTGSAMLRETSSPAVPSGATVMLAEWGAALAGAALALLAAQALGCGGASVTTACLVLASVLAGGLLRKRWPDVGVAPLLKGSLLYLASLAALLFCLGRLSLGTAQAIARWHGQAGIGPSVGLLLFQLAAVPLLLGSGWRRGRRRAQP